MEWLNYFICALFFHILSIETTVSRTEKQLFSELYKRNKDANQVYSGMKCGELSVPIKEYLNVRLPFNYFYEEALHIQVDTSYDSVKHLGQLSGFDIFSLDGLGDFSCALEDLENLHELAEFLNTPRGIVTHKYVKLVGTFWDFGGFDAAFKFAEATTRLLSWLQDSGYPEVPILEGLKDGKKIIQSFVEEMQISFGVEYLSETFRKFPFPVAYPPFFVAELLTETSSVEELSDLLGVDSEEMRTFASMLNPEGVTAILQDLWGTVYLLEALYDHTSLM